MTDNTKISIPRHLVEKIKERIEGTNFDSVSSYVAYVLGQVLSITSEEKQKESFTDKDEEKIKEKLRSLGYME